jgi:sugar phosphate isomerase/epimerase
MTVKFSIAHLTVLGTTPLDLIQIAADAGYDYVSIRMTPVAEGEHVTPLAGDPDMVRRVSKRLADTGLEVLDVELARLGPDDEPDKYRGVLEAAAAIGARHVLGQLNDPDRDRGTESFGRLCDLALEFGLTVDLEFPSWSETGDLVAAAAVVRAVNRSNAGILVDVLHFFRSDSSIEQLAALPREWFRFVQLCDAPAEAAPTVEGVIHTARSARSLPGYGHLPLRDLLEHLPAGPYSLEVPNDVLRRELGTTEYARLVLATARDVVADRGLPAMAR